VNVTFLDPAATLILWLLAGGLVLTALLCYIPDRGRSETDENRSDLGRGEWRWGKVGVKAWVGKDDKGDFVGFEIGLAGPAQAVWLDPGRCRLWRGGGSAGRGGPGDWIGPSAVELAAFGPPHLPEALARRGTVYGPGSFRRYNLRFEGPVDPGVGLRVPLYDQVLDVELEPVLTCPGESLRGEGSPGEGPHG
jgi:hypothetical protein